jgi:hypothetical protein
MTRLVADVRVAISGSLRLRPPIRENVKAHYLSLIEP